MSAGRYRKDIGSSVSLDEEEITKSLCNISKRGRSLPTSGQTPRDITQT